MKTEQAAETAASTDLTSVDVRDLVSELMRRSENAQFISEISGKFYAQTTGRAEIILGMMKIHEGLLLKDYFDRSQVGAAEVVV